MQFLAVEYVLSPLRICLSEAIYSKIQKAIDVETGLVILSPIPNMDSCMFVWQFAGSSLIFHGKIHGFLRFRLRFFPNPWPFFAPFSAEEWMFRRGPWPLDDRWPGHPDASGTWDEWPSIGMCPIFLDDLTLWIQTLPEKVLRSSWIHRVFSLMLIYDDISPMKLLMFPYIFHIFPRFRGFQPVCDHRQGLGLTASPRPEIVERAELHDVTCHCLLAMSSYT